MNTGKEIKLYTIMLTNAMVNIARFRNLELSSTTF